MHLKDKVFYLNPIRPYILNCRGTYIARDERKVLCPIEPVTQTEVDNIVPLFATATSHTLTTDVITTQSRVYHNAWIVTC